VVEQQDTEPAIFETARDAAATVQHIRASPKESWKDGCHRLLEDTARTEGVELGAFDQQTLLALADEGLLKVAVVVSLMRRAHAAGFEAGRDTLNAAGVAMPGGGWISGPSA
jgi:hypothetical protein